MNMDNKSILDILSKNTVFERHKYVLDESRKGDEFMQLYITIRDKNEIELIKEWLKNGKKCKVDS